jgi:trans-2,3-dihydro-3-hydroxyanthranilate isomerase
MGSLRFYILDVFAEQKYAGNQLAVFRNPAGISGREMQQIAREMNFSETTFIASEEPHQGGYDVRIFTPAEEVPFAGHPTLGTAYLIQQEIIARPVESVTLNLKVGQIPVTFSYSEGKPDVLWMQQKAPVFGPVFDRARIARVLSIDRTDIDSRLPIQEVSTGLPFIIVPLRRLATVKKARTDRDSYFALVKTTQAKGILLFCPETYDQENDLNVRMFADWYGVPEDPATGSANGCLAAWLTKYRYFETSTINIRVEQGCEIGRPSLLFLRTESVRRALQVHVGGRVRLVAQGEFV